MSVRSFAQSVAVTTALGTTAAFRFTDMVSGRILLPDGENTSLTFYECDTIDGTYVLCDDVGTNGVVAVVTAAVTPKSYVIPTALAGSRFIKIVANVADVTATVVTKDE
ncbi:MAG TPA: hypothetical protein VNA25_22920 [Phycisphaerae bacterium]|nr:hypothetical protein [Phycisphaerae bacterium]